MFSIRGLQDRITNRDKIRELTVENMEYQKDIDIIVKMNTQLLEDIKALKTRVELIIRGSKSAPTQNKQLNSEQEGKTG